jgi:flavorubredoxin
VHTSYLLADLWPLRGLVLGGPTYNQRLFPPLEYLVEMLENKAMKGRCLGVFGTFTWSGGGVKRLREFAGKGNWRVIEPTVEAKCSPTDADLAGCFQLGRAMAAAVCEEQ